MEQWNKEKLQITQKVLEKLRQEGKLPKDATIYFTAKVKSKPDGDLDIHIESLQIYPKSREKHNNEKVSKEFEEIFRPRNPAPYWTTGKIDIVGGKVVSEEVTIVPKVEGSKTSAEKKEDRPSEGEVAEPKENGWWHRFWQKFLGK